MKDPTVSKPLIAVWGDAAQLTEDWLNTVTAAGSPADLSGIRGSDLPLTPELALKQALGQRQQQPICLLRAGLCLPDYWLMRLLGVAAVTEASITLPLSNLARDLSPLPIGAQLPSKLDWKRLDNLSWLHSDRGWFTSRTLSPECLLWQLSSEDHAVLDQLDWQSLSEAVAAVGADIAVCDHLYVHQNDLAARGPSAPRPPAKPRPASPLDAARAAVLTAFEQGQDHLPYPGLDTKPVQLHVLHSWGGGVAKWVADLARSQDDRHHLMLTAGGRPEDFEYGQQLSLFVASLQSEPVRRWTLPRSIRATAISSADYLAVVQAVINDFKVDQIVVSSLIGHALDILRTDLPTAIVFHDYYPAWPDLQINFENHSGGFAQTDLEQALKSGVGRLFPEQSASAWIALREQYLEDLNRPGLRFAAPSNSVGANLARIDKRFAQLQIERISHGIDGWKSNEFSYQPPTAPLQRKLRLVVPGRISSGKGKQLLRDSIEALREVAEVYLLGAGKDGMDFFGVSGIHIVLDYQLHELPALMSAIQPDLALLLSTVSETFSYTLSEMQMLGLPVLATRVGSLEERIEHEVTGLLTEPCPDRLVEAVAKIAQQPAVLVDISKRLAKLQPSLLTEMAAAYSKLMPLPEQPAGRYRLSQVGLERMQLAQLAQTQRLLELSSKQQGAKLEQQQTELERRATWAFRLSGQLAERTRWASSLESDLKDSVQALGHLQGEFEERTDWALQLDSDVKQRDQHIAVQNRAIDELSEIAERHEQVITSRSWRWTRPIRFVLRKLDAISEGIGMRGRRAASQARRTRQSLRVRGINGTLKRIQEELRGAAVHGTPIATAELDVAIEPFDFERPEKPLVSIVIPVFNQFRYTYACLKSIAKCGDAASFEVIVVDDASDDDTAAWLPQFAGLTYLRNRSNLGFIGSCNRGAENAAGEFVLFLNNDTLVADGWLDAMLKVFDQADEVGLVGAKLVYPDGRLQEAGGIIFSDGSGWNYGRFEHPDHPCFNFLREVDYCSGACIVLRRALFEQLGAFDTRYAPAYYEDTDLAFKVREAGLKVYYQPQAVVTHFEGITSGTDLSSGIKQYQVLNQEKFKQRWAEALARQPGPNTNIEVARQHRRQRHALIVDHRIPAPDQDSGSVRMVNLMTLLQELGYRVTFVPDNRAYVDTYTEALQQRGIEVLYHPLAPKPNELLADIGKNLDLIILSRHYIACNYVALVRRHCPNAKVFFDTVDLHYLREQRLAELEGDEKMARIAARTRTDELAVARACDVTLVVSPYEKTFLNKEAPDLKVAVLSNIHEIFGSRKPYAERQDILFVGGYEHPPNIDAVIWFAQQIFPLIQKKLPDLIFHIVGSKSTPEVRALDGNGVQFHGFVADLEPFLDGCRLAVAPLRYGAGIKGKINMSMSYGQPVVATSPAVEGMNAKPGEAVMVGDDPEAFARAVIQVYGDEALWQKLSENGLRNVEKYFSFAAAKRALAELLVN